MGVTNSNKVINTDRIACDGSLRVSLTLTAAPDIITNPTDIVLILDRSGSMAGIPLTNMKLGAKTFIDIIDEATDNTQDGQIGSGSRIGIVSFSNTAVANTQLITSVDTLKSAVDGLTASGTTNHADAFTKAIQLFDPASSNAKVIVIFTDGNTTTGAPPAPVAAAARAQGIVIYCIGLIGSDGLDIGALNDWATDPDTSHVAVTPDDADLEQLFHQFKQLFRIFGTEIPQLSESGLKLHRHVQLVQLFIRAVGEPVLQPLQKQMAPKSRIKGARPRFSCTNRWASSSPGNSRRLATAQTPAPQATSSSRETACTAASVRITRSRDTGVASSQAIVPRSRRCTSSRFASRMASTKGKTINKKP